MKKPGNKSDFIEDRNHDLHRNFMEVLRTSKDLPLRLMFGEAAKRPASRFWVSESRAAIVIGAMMRGEADDRMFEKRKDMYQEIYRRVIKKMNDNPKLCMTHAVNETVYEPAPEFYLTSESARSIIYRMRQRKKLLSKLKKSCHEDS